MRCVLWLLSNLDLCHEPMGQETRLGRSLAIRLTYDEQATLQAVTRVKREPASKGSIRMPTRLKVGAKLDGQGIQIPAPENACVYNQQAPVPVHRGSEHSMQGK